MAAYTVINLNDVGVGSLRDAIDQVNAGLFDIVEFQAGLTGTIEIFSGLPENTRNITINGPGSSAITVHANANSGVLNRYRVFTIGNGITANINGLTVSGGYGPVAATPNSDGGGILVYQASTANLDNMVVTENTAETRGGGIGVTLASTLNLTNSSVTNNVVDVFQGGGIFVDASTANIEFVTVSGNTANGAAGLGAGIFTNGTTNINYSTISFNSSPLSVNAAGGLQMAGATVNVFYSTFNTNTGQNANNIGANGTLNFINSTSAYTVADIVPNISIDAGTTTMVNSTVQGAGATRIVGTLNLGNSIINSTFGNAPVPIGPNFIGNPALTPLQNNGGPTDTYAPVAGSPVIDTGDNTLALAFSMTDQREFFRIWPPAGTVDIGSVEFASQPVCYSGTSMVLTKNKLTGEIKEIEAKKVFSDIHEVFDTNKKIFVPIIFNVVGIPIKRFMKIRKDAFGENLPNANFYVTGGHKILVNGSLVKARDIHCAERVKVKSQEVYSICTEEESTIMINGLSVAATAANDWLEYSKKKCINWRNNKPRKVMKELSINQ